MMFYLDLFRELEQHGVRYLLVGGLALNIHGVERATMDVDLALALSDENLEAFIRAAIVLGLSPVAPVPLAHLADESKRREWSEEKGMIAFALRPAQPSAPTIDVLIKLPVDFEGAWRRREDKQLGAMRVSLASLDDLIAMKQDTGRSKDASDVVAMRRLKELKGRL